MNSVQAFKARSRADNGVQRVEIDIYDVIGRDPFFGGGVGSKEILDAIRPVGPGGEIECRINSVGGVVTEGLAIYNDLQRKVAEGVKVVCRVDSLAGSIASVIAMAGQTVMAEHSFLMIHNPYGFVDGEAEDLRNTAKVLDAMREQILDIYASKGKSSREALGAMMDAETYLTPREAMAFGLCNEIAEDPQVKLVAYFDLSRFRKLPKAAAELVAQTAKDDLVVFDGDVKLGADTADQPIQPAPPAPPTADTTGATPMAMTEEEQKEFNDLKAQNETLNAALEAEKGARSTAEDALAKAKKASEEEEEDDEEEMAKAAVVAEAIELTGVKDLAKLPGALAGVAFKLQSGGVKDVHQARVKRLIDEGKLPPHMKAKALAWTPAKLDGFIEMTGGEKFAPVAEEHTPDENAPEVKAARSATAAPTFDPEAIQLSDDEQKIVAQMSVNDPKLGERMLAEKRQKAESAHRAKYRLSA